MKSRIIILLFSYCLLFNSCLVDNFEESSLLLDSITEVKLTSNDTLFLKKEGTYEVKYVLRYFSKQREVNLKNTVKPKLYLNGLEVEKTEIDLSKETTYTLEAEFPNKSKTLSNKLNIKVLPLNQVIAEISLKSIDNTYFINKVEFQQNKLLDFIEISARLKTSEVVDLKPFTEIYSLEYNEVKLSNVSISGLPDGKFRLRATVGQVFSNSIDFEVFDPMTYIKRIDLLLDERTRNNYAVAGSSELDFSYQVIGMDDAILPIPASLIVDGQKQNSFKNVPINQAGLVNVHAEISGKKSNTIQVISRQNQVLPKIQVPIIFHVLDNLNKGISRATVDFELEKLNTAFANQFQLQPALPKSSNAVNIHMEFYLADRDESGNLLQENGINRISSGGQTFSLSSNEANYLFQRMWDPRKYVNVFVGRMDSPFGYAYYPVVKDIDLPGMSRIFDDYVLTYPYVTVISDNAMGLANNSTLAHEIGHMLALLHPFEQNSNGFECIDGDYCPDTETYLIDATNSPFVSPSNIVQNCLQQTFFSVNIMDYVDRRNSFTFDQRDRMRTAAIFNPFFAKEGNFTNSRLKPFEKGKLNPNIKPVACPNQNHFGRRFHNH
jgi:hypothetical protein